MESRRVAGATRASRMLVEAGSGSQDHEIAGRRISNVSMPASRPAIASKEEAHPQRQLRVRREERVDRRGLAAPFRQDSNEAARPNIEGDVNPGFHDEATTGERPIVRHLAIVAAQAGRDFQFDCLSGLGLRASNWVSRAAVQYAFVARQVLRTRRARHGFRDSPAQRR